MAFRAVILDFDGTLGDTSGAVLDAVNKTAETIGKGPLTESDIAFFRENGARAFFKKNKISVFALPSLISKGRRFFAETKDIRPISGVKDAVIALKNKGTALFLVSSNTKENINKFLAANGMEDVFTDIVCEKGLFGKGKMIKKVADKLGSAGAVYVGDETRDGEAARTAGIPFIGVSWGFNSAPSLIAAGAVRVISSPEELAEI